MENKDLIAEFFEKVIDDLKKDAASKNQKFPVSSLRHEEDNVSGKLYGADYIKYLVYGRGPGKQPPPDAMLKSVQQHPEWLVSAKQKFKYITEKSLAYLIGRKIGREGTEIYKGTKKGIDLLGSIEKNFPELTKQLLRNEAVNITTALKSNTK